jgi:hypothetical protein
MSPKIDGLECLVEITLPHYGNARTFEYNMFPSFIGLAQGQCQLRCQSLGAKCGIIGFGDTVGISVFGLKDYIGKPISAFKIGFSDIVEKRSVGCDFQLDCSNSFHYS